jgi:hypothetical protein
MGDRTIWVLVSGDEFPLVVGAFDSAEAAADAIGLGQGNVFIQSCRLQGSLPR